MTMDNDARGGAYATDRRRVDSERTPPRRRDLRVERTREAIEGAFRAMVCEMPADAITVKELTQRARIHRKTFYLHHASIEALFEEMIERLAGHYFDDIDAISPSMPTEEVNRVFFEHVARQDEFYERLVTAPGYRELAAKLFSITLRHNRERHNPYAHLPEAEQAIVNTFLVSATLDMYRQWAADGRRVGLERMIELSSQLLAHGANSVRVDG